MSGRFLNNLTNELTEDAVEQRGFGWYIKLGFSGFNSPANNRMGYKSQAAAESAILRFQRKGK